uniref:Ribonuclease Y n=1 Tax=Lygus hesperus TaxID=30085 RepID=A0A0A9Z931_LYGHE
MSSCPQSSAKTQVTARLDVWTLPASLGVEMLNPTLDGEGAYQAFQRASHKFISSISTVDTLDFRGNRESMASTQKESVPSRRREKQRIDYGRDPKQQQIRNPLQEDGTRLIPRDRA